MTPTRRRHAPRLHPIGLAALLALAGSAMALPQGATVVSGQVRIGNPSATLQVVTQVSNRGIVDWSSFSLAAGERVRFDQPSASAVLLNRVTGSDPSRIFGQIQSNGQIFLLNPNGVVFGSSARIDVGGLVASSLSLSNADFQAGRYRLGGDDAAAGAVRNDGVIRAPGGTVALVAPQVSNRGTIEAPQGRVGLAAGQKVLVDVEGDGLVFFELRGSEAGNRLAQLGRIAADAGSVELRAAARGAVADTVLNMSGIVQARGLGQRDGRVVIDGGAAGLTRMAGAVDVSGEWHGGHAEVTGARVQLDASARLDASGGSAGGTVLVGGNWQGQGPQRNAARTDVAAGALIDVSATGQGDGGTAVVWSDGATSFQGHIAARGGAAGGDGGRIEVSGKQTLAFSGTVDARAAHGRRGTLLLDPSQITIQDSGTDDTSQSGDTIRGNSDSSILLETTLKAALQNADVTVDATAGGGNANPSTITVASELDLATDNTLTLKAAGAITLDAGISNTQGGSLNLYSSGSIGGAGGIDLAGGNLRVGGTTSTGTNLTRAGSFSLGGILTTAPNSGASGDVTIRTSGALSVGVINTNASGANAANDGAVTLNAGANLTLNDDINAGGASVALLFGQQSSGSTLSWVGGVSITAGAIDATGGTNSTLDVTSNAASITLAGSAPGAGTLTLGTAREVTLASIGSVALTGGNGVNTIVAATWDGNLQVQTSAGNDTLTGNGSRTTLTREASGADGNWTLSGANDGQVNAGTGTTRFTDVGQLVGGGGADAFVFQAGGSVASVTGGATGGTLDLGARTGAVTINLGVATGSGAVTGVVGSFDGITAVQGNDGFGAGRSTTLVGPDTGLSFTLAGAGSGSAGTLAFGGVTSLRGGSGADSFGGNGSLAGTLQDGGGATTLGGSIETGATQTYAGAVTLGSATSLRATGSSADILFTGSLDGTTAGAEALTLAAGRTISWQGGVGANVSLGALDATAGAALRRGAALVVDSASLTLDASAVDPSVVGYFRGGAASLVRIQSGSTGHDLTVQGASALPALHVTGNLDLQAAADLTQAGLLQVDGTTRVDAGAHAILLGQFDNLFGDAVSLSNTGANAVALKSGGATRLGALTVGSGPLSISSAGPVTQSGTAVLTQGGAGAVDISAPGQAITLSGADNDFAGPLQLTGAAVAVRAAGGLRLAAAQADTLDIDAGGAITQDAPLAVAGASRFASSDGGIALPLANVLGGSVTLEAPGAQNVALGSAGALQIASASLGSGTLALTAAGRIGQDGAITQTGAGAVTVDAGANPIVLDHAGNNFVGPVSLANSGANEVVLRDAGALALGTLTLGSGTLNLQSNGALTQSGPITQAAAAGAVTIAAGSNGDITLDHAGNDFTGPVGASGRAIALADANDLNVSATPTAGRAFSLVAGGLLTLGSYDLDTGSGALTLSFGTLGGTLGTLAGGNVSLYGADGLTLGDVTAGGTLALGTANRTITQGAGTRLDATGTSTVNAGSGDVLLGNAGNQFRDSVDVTGGSVMLRSAGALGIGTLSSGADQAVTLEAGQALTIASGAIDTGSAALTLTSGALLQTGGALAGGTVTLNGGGGVSIRNDIDARGDLALNATGGTITQSAGAVRVAGATHIDAGSGAVTLAGSANDLRGDVQVTSGALSLRTLGALTLTNLSQSADSALSLVAGGALSLPGTGIDTGTANLSLSAASFTGGAPSLAGQDIHLSSTDALQLGDIAARGDLALETAGTAITQRSGTALRAGGNTTIGSGAGAVLLANAGNDFVGSVAADTGALTLHDTNTLSLGDIVARGALGLSTGTGAITQAGSTIQVTGTTTLDAGGRALTLGGTGNDFGAAVAASGGSVTLRSQGALRLGAVQATNLTLTVGGDLSQSAAASVTGTLSVNAAGHDVTLDQAGNRFGSVAATGAVVTLVDADDLVLGATTAQRLDVTAGGRLSQSAALGADEARFVAGGDLTLTAGQNRLGSVDLSGAAVRVRDLDDLTVTALRSGTDQAVSLTAGGTLTLPSGNIDTGTAELLLASAAGRLATRGNVAGQTVRLTGSGGIELGGDVRSATDQTYATQVTLAADATLDAGGGRVVLASGLSGAGHALAVTGAATVRGDVTGTSAQQWSGRVTLGTDSTFSGGRLVLAAGASTGSHDLTLGSAATLGGSVSGAGAQTYRARVRLADDLTLQSSAGRIDLQGGLDGAGHALTLSSGLAAADAVRTGDRMAGLGALTVEARATLGGHVSGNGDQHYTGAVTLASDATLDAGSGTLVLDGAVDGGTHRLGLASSQAGAAAIRTGAAITNAAALVVDGAVALGGDVTSSGAQRYQGSVRLDRDLTLDGSALRFDSTLDGAQALTLRSGALVLGGDVGSGSALTQLTVQRRAGAGLTSVGGVVRTSGAQTWDHALRLTGDTTLTGSALQLRGAVDDASAGAHTLTLSGSDAPTVLDAAVGGTTALGALTIAGPATLGGGRIATTGAQHYDGALDLAADLALSGATLEVTGAIDGRHALGLDFSGTSTLGGAVGSGTSLTSLSSTGALQLQAASVSTTGLQHYGAGLQLAGDTQLSAASLQFDGPVRGANDLLLSTDRLQASDIAGTGVLRITPRSAGTTIGIAGGAGMLQIGQALVSSAGGFTRHEFGRADGSGTITVGAWQLGADTLLQNGRGELALAGRVDGAFDLALNTGGLTHISGPVGSLTPLASLSTDKRGTAGEQTLIDGGATPLRIATSGVQTWGDALVTQRPVLLVGSLVEAGQDANRFGGAVSVDAGTLQLRSAEGIELEDLRLAQGGRVESGGVLRLSGALQLDGGTLQLVSDAAPGAGAFTDAELLRQAQLHGPLRYDQNLLREASATIEQVGDAAIVSAAGSLLVLRSTRGGTIDLRGAGNRLLGEVSALSGSSDGASPVGPGGRYTLGFVRINSSEIHVAGGPPAAGAPDTGRAGIEADAVWLGTDLLRTGSDGLVRVRLPYLDRQGSDSSVPALTLVLGDNALAGSGAFGSTDAALQVQVGDTQGGYLTVRPRGVGPQTRAVIVLVGPDPRPFYDGAGKSTEIRVFYNGDAPRTPEETGALSAVTATVEDARQTRFEETVRTENVKSRLRSGVIAEVGSGRPATVGRESIRLPENCSVRSNSLSCQ